MADSHEQSREARSACSRLESAGPRGPEADKMDHHHGVRDNDLRRDRHEHGIGQERLVQLSECVVRGCQLAESVWLLVAGFPDRAAFTSTEPATRPGSSRTPRTRPSRVTTRAERGPSARARDSAKARSEGPDPERVGPSTGAKDPMSKPSTPL